MNRSAIETVDQYTAALNRVSSNPQMNRSAIETLPTSTSAFVISSSSNPQMNRSAIETTFTVINDGNVFAQTLK